MYAFAVLTAWGAELKGPEADVIERLIIKDHAFISILHQLMNRKCGIIRLHNSVRYLWRRED